MTYGEILEGLTKQEQETLDNLIKLTVDKLHTLGLARVVPCAINIPRPLLQVLGRAWNERNKYQSYYGSYIQRDFGVIDTSSGETSLTFLGLKVRISNQDETEIVIRL